VESKTGGFPFVPFLKRTEVNIEFEAVRLGRLFRRRFRRPLDEPQRLGFYQVFCGTKGEGRYTVDFETHAYEPGDLVFSAPGQIQQFHPSPNVDGILLVFTNEFFAQEPSDQPLLSSSLLFNPWSPSPVVRPGAKGDFGFLGAFRALEREYRRGSRDVFREPLLRSMLKTILLQAERLKQRSSSPAAIVQLPRFLQFKTLLERGFGSMRKVGEYAAEMGVSARTLNRVTRLASGLTAKDFIDARVVLELKRLLAHTDLGLKEITSAMGFDEPTNLVKYFRQRTRLRPMQFRATWRKRGAFLP